MSKRFGWIAIWVSLALHCLVVLYLWLTPPPDRPKREKEDIDFGKLELVELSIPKADLGEPSSQPQELESAEAKPPQEKFPSQAPLPPIKRQAQSRPDNGEPKSHSQDEGSPKKIVQEPSQNPSQKISLSLGALRASRKEARQEKALHKVEASNGIAQTQSSSLLAQQARSGVHPNLSNGRRSNKQEKPAVRSSNDGSYKFVRDVDGKLAYFDPESRFNAVLRDDGSLELETNGRAKGGVCIGFLCASAGGVRSQGQKKRKGNFRFKFSPVPSIGLGFGFGPKHPYSKAISDFLRATYLTRLDMYVRYQKTLFRKYNRQLRMNLISIWENNGLSTQEKKSRILSIYRDCSNDDTNPESTSKDSLPALSNTHSSRLSKIRKDASEKAQSMIRNFAIEHRAEIEDGGFKSNELAQLGIQSSDATK